MIPQDTLLRALLALHYIYPAIAFVYFLISTGISTLTSQSRQQTSRASLQGHRPLLTGLLALCVCTYVAQIVSETVASAISGTLIGNEDEAICIFSCVLVFGIQYVSLLDSKPSVWYPYYGCWVVALVFEPAIGVLSFFS